jgi:nicotinamide-nucleotide amidase
MLLGDLVDTNTAWISQRLAGLGVGIYRHTTVGDNSERIVAALREAASKSDLVVTTGGLGPTSDDLTNACVSTLTGRKMVEYPEARKHVDRMFTKFDRKPTANNYKQALFPEETRLIPNPVGTAMGALVEWKGTLLATLPGVPSEMKSMFEATLEPLIRARSEGSIVSKTLHFAGIGESALAEKVQEFLDATDPTVAPLAGQGRVRLRITTRAATEKEAQEKITPVEKEVIARLGDYYFGKDDETLESAVGRLLVERGATLALAESCTGGLLAKRLTDMPGSSAYFGEGLVTYSNASKEILLGVPHGLIMDGHRCRRSGRRNGGEARRARLRRDLRFGGYVRTQARPHRLGPLQGLDPRAEREPGLRPPQASPGRGPILTITLAGYKTQ